MVGSTRYGPLVLVATLLGLGAIYLVTTLAADRPTDTKMFPGALAVAFMALLVWEGVAMLAERAPDATATAADEAPPPEAEAGSSAEAGPGGSASGRRSVAATFFGLVVLTALFAYVGTQVDYVLSTVVFMAAAMWLIGAARRSWAVTAVVAVTSVVAVNLIFVQVLSVRLPSLIPGL